MEDGLTLELTGRPDEVGSSSSSSSQSSSSPSSPSSPSGLPEGEGDGEAGGVAEVARKELVGNKELGVTDEG